MPQTNTLAGLSTVLRGARKALLLGVGGGGDIVGTIPTARLLELFGIESLLGGLSWERFVHDPQPGTRKLEEVRNVKPLAATVWLANADTVSIGGVRFAETQVAAVYRTDTVLVDLSRGVRGVIAGLRAAMSALGADLLIGVDVGGDSMAQGDEPGLRSPLADAMMLAALAALSVEHDVLWVILGLGADGELSRAECERALAKVVAGGGLLGAWGITPEVAAELEQLTGHVNTEASRIVLRAARGEVGTAEIREGTRQVEISPICAVGFYLHPGVLARTTPLPQAVSHSASLEEANTALLARGISTEYEFEKEMLARGLHHYPQQ